MDKNIHDYINNSTSRQPQEEAVRQQVDNYGRMNQQELMQEMSRLAREGKASGNLNVQEFNDFYNQVSPMLTQQQRNNLMQLINNLK